MTAPATMQSVALLRSGADDRDSDDAKRSFAEEWR
jgi:hypothetical protein